MSSYRFDATFSQLSNIYLIHSIISVIRNNCIYKCASDKTSENFIIRTRKHQCNFHHFQQTPISIMYDKEGKHQMFAARHLWLGLVSGLVTRL